MRLTRDCMLALLWFAVIMGGLGLTGGLEAKWAAEEQARTVQTQAGR